MPSIRLIFFVALLAALVLARPAAVSERDVQKRSFKIPRQINPAFPGRNGAAAMKKVFNKYNLEIRGDMTGLIGKDAASGGNLRPSTAATATSSAPSSATGAVRGTVAARPEDQTGAEFISPVTIGQQKFMLDFDTGSSDLWVFSTDLSKSAIGSRAAFDASKSPTFQPAAGLTWQISYGDGSGASGRVGHDSVQVGNVNVGNQTVELAQQVSQSFINDAAISGLLGMAFGKLNTVKQNNKRLPQPTFFENVMGQLTEPVFTANLALDGTGSYDFGGVDSTQFTGPMVWAPVNQSSGFWQFTSTRFQVGNGQVMQSNNPSPAIADTGTSLMLVDQPVADAYYSQVSNAVLDPTAGGYIYPCGTTLPDFSFDAGGNMVKVPGSVINFSAVDSQNQVCFGGIQGNMGAGMQIMGDIMFRAQLVAFHGGNATLGFGQKLSQGTRATQ